MLWFSFAFNSTFNFYIEWYFVKMDPSKKVKLFFCLQAVVNFITMQFQLCTVFFTFSLGTRTHYFGRTILHGGARVCVPTLCPLLLHFFYNLLICLCQQYQATGRGFVVRHIKFSENYRLYSRSHFVKGWGSLFL